MVQDSHLPTADNKKSSFSWFKLFAIISVATALGGAFAIWLVTVFLFPREFKPVTLKPAEEQVLQAKFRYLEAPPKSRQTVSRRTEKSKNGADDFKPQPYSEVGARREVTFTEREVNALLAKNTELAKKLSIDFSDNLASARLILHVDKDFPVLGGKTIKASTGLELSYSGGKPTVILKGVSLWGVPVPNAWLGNLKNIDLVEKFGQERGFWKAFAAGVEDIKISDGQLRIKLKE